MRKHAWKYYRPDDQLLKVEFTIRPGDAPSRDDPGSAHEIEIFSITPDAGVGEAERQAIIADIDQNFDWSQDGPDPDDMRDLAIERRRLDLEGTI